MEALLPIILPLLGQVLGKIIPDSNQALQIQTELQKAILENSATIDKAIADAAAAQASINLAEANSASMFVAGWRPFIGWACGVGFIYACLVQPILAWFALMLHVAPPPVMETSLLMTTLGGMLGLGSLRTVEKINGVANTSIVAAGNAVAATVSRIARPILRRAS